MALKKEKFDKYLYIENGVIYTKKKARIVFDLTEYKNINEEFDLEEKGEEVSIEQVGNNTYEVPGFFTLEFLDEADSIQFYFPYNVYVFVTDDSEESSKEIVLNYEEDAAVFYGKYRKEETNVKILDKLFENGIKYLSNRMDLLVYNIWKQIASTLNIPWQHIEMLVSQLFAVKENGHWIPVRASKDQIYCKENAINTKQSAHRLNDMLGFFYGYSNDAIMTSVTNNRNQDKNKETTSFIEKIIKGDYNVYEKDKE